jgi:hypothetical protein
MRWFLDGTRIVQLAVYRLADAQAGTRPPGRIVVRICAAEVVRHRGSQCRQSGQPGLNGPRSGTGEQGSNTELATVTSCLTAWRRRSARQYSSGAPAGSSDLEFRGCGARWLWLGPWCRSRCGSVTVIAVALPHRPGPARPGVRRGAARAGGCVTAGSYEAGLIAACRRSTSWFPAYPRPSIRRLDRILGEDARDQSRFMAIDNPRSRPSCWLRQAILLLSTGVIPTCE